MSEASEPASSAPPAEQPGGATAGGEEVGSGTNGDWRAGLPDDLRSFAEKKGWADPAQALQGYRGLEQLLGADRAGRTVTMPKEGADEQERAAFFERLGRPPEPAGYGLEQREGADPQWASEAARVMHEAGLSKSQAEQLAGWWESQLAGRQRQAETDYAARTRADLEALTAEWGAQAQERIETARRYARAAGFEEGELDAIERAIGTRAMLERFDAAGRGLMEDAAPADSAGVQTPATPQAARAALDRMLGDPEQSKMLMDARHPGHRDAVERKSRLERLIAGVREAA